MIIAMLEATVTKLDNVIRDTVVSAGSGTELAKASPRSHIFSNGDGKG